MASSTEDGVRDEDRLPWLETVDDDYKDSTGFLRIAMFVLLALVIIVTLFLAVYWMRQPPAATGTGALIEAQEGDYKVKPDNPGGMKVEGEGDTAFATSEGKGAGNASIDLKAMPEAPVAGKPATSTKPVGAVATAGKVPASNGKLAAPAPMTAPGKLAVASGGASGGSLVQLGSFPTESAASVAWSRSSKRFAFLAPLGKSVQPASVNGATVYRLRVNAGSASQAAELCAKLKIAGEACFVPKN